MLGEALVVQACSQMEVSWASSPARVQEYCDVSYGKPLDDPSRKTLSWCSFFAYWVLVRAGVSNRPDTWRFVKTIGSNAVQRFEKYPSQTQPAPGDLYYMPNVPGAKNPVHHIGFIWVPNCYPGWHLTIDGNAAGPSGYWNYNLGAGGGKVTWNLRDATKIAWYRRAS